MKAPTGDFVLAPPIAPMLAKPGSALPPGEGWLYEPKWDGFRALVFRKGDDVYIQSRDEKPLNRYFPELIEPLRANLPESCVLDGEVVVVKDGVLDFDTMLIRIHPAASRVALLAKEHPAAFVAWDLLALDDQDLREKRQDERREALERALAGAEAPIFVTPMTRDATLAQEWFERFEGAGFDGVIAKPADAVYTPGKRIMTKVKHTRTADCVVGGFRWYKDAEDELVGSLLLGLYDEASKLRHLGICSAFTREVRKELTSRLAPYREGAREGHPWLEEEREATRIPGATSRWNRGKDLSWEPLRLELVCEVRYDHLQGDRFRHATQFERWRPDKAPADCRYDQLEVTPPALLASIFGSSTAG